jgi:hypothetical protein
MNYPVNQTLEREEIRMQECLGAIGVQAYIYRNRIPPSTFLTFEILHILIPANRTSVKGFRRSNGSGVGVRSSEFKVSNGDMSGPGPSLLSQKAKIKT